MSLILLDTSVLVPLRDRDLDLIERLAPFVDDVIVSSISLVELEGGVHRDPRYATMRKRALEELLQGVKVVSFGKREADLYGSIVSRCGFSRRKIIDRMIAAQAIAENAELVTLNPTDVAEVPGLRIRPWASIP